MAAPRGFHAAYLAATMADTRDWGPKARYLAVDVHWHSPQPWSPTDVHTVHADMDQGCLYAVVRDHHRNAHRENIVYVGITRTPRTRFYNHPKVDEIRAMRGDKTVVFGVPNFGRTRTYKEDARPALEELEHLFIWALHANHDLLNTSKMWTLPGMGSNPGRAWHITNGGHRFAGRMPREIVYPWMLVKPGRDRSKRIPSDGN